MKVYKTATHMKTMNGAQVIKEDHMAAQKSIAKKERILKLLKSMQEIDLEIKEYYESGSTVDWIEELVDIDRIVRKMRNLDFIYRSYYSSEFVEFYYSGVDLESAKFTLRAYTEKGIDFNQDMELQIIKSFLHFFRKNSIEFKNFERFIDAKHSDFKVTIKDYI